MSLHIVGFLLGTGGFVIFVVVCFVEFFFFVIFVVLVGFDYISRILCWLYRLLWLLVMVEGRTKTRRTVNSCAGGGTTASGTLGGSYRFCNLDQP